MSGRNRAVALVVAVLAAAVGLLLAAGSSSAKPRPYHHHHHPRLSCTPKPGIGAQMTVQGNDFLPHDHVVLTLHTKVYQLGSANADGQGDFQKVVQLPAGVSGPHTVVATGQGSASTDVASCPLNIGGQGTGGEGTGGNTNGGGTSFTGVEIAGIGVVGVGLLAVGTLLVLSARKRRTAESD